MSNIQQIVKLDVRSLLNESTVNTDQQLLPSALTSLLYNNQYNYSGGDLINKLKTELTPQVREIAATARDIVRESVEKKIRKIRCPVECIPNKLGSLSPTSSSTRSVQSSSPPRRPLQQVQRPQSPPRPPQAQRSPAPTPLPQEARRPPSPPGRPQQGQRPSPQEARRAPSPPGRPQQGQRPSSGQSVPPTQPRPRSPNQSKQNQTDAIKTQKPRQMVKSILDTAYSGTSSESPRGPLNDNLQMQIKQLELDLLKLNEKLSVLKSKLKIN